MTRAQIEKTWGVTIVENGYTNRQGKYKKLYDIYSADGCSWDKGFQTIAAVEKECRKQSSILLAIAGVV